MPAHHRRRAGSWRWTAPSFVLLIVCGWLTPGSQADDWPQWRGPRRDGISNEKLTLAAWPDGKPAAIAWRINVGKGHASLSIVGGRGYIAGWDGKKDTVLCIDLADGKSNWKVSYACDTIVQWPGPRATPTVAGDSVFSLGQHGQLQAFDAKTGEFRWNKQLSPKAKPDDDYGFVWSPLVVDDLLILPVGKGGLALKTRDGSVAWGDDQSRGACASAVPFTHIDASGAKVPAAAMILTHDDRNSSYLLAVESRTGKPLWRHERWPEKWGAVCVDLVTDGKAVFVTSSEQHKQCARFTIAGAALKQDWSHSKFACYTGGAVLIGGHLYGIDTKRGGQLKCLDWATGEEQWSQPEFGTHAALIAAGDRLIVQTSETGELVIAQATPKEYVEQRRMKVFAGRANTFTPPVVANGRVYCRSYEGELVSVKVD